MRMLRSLLVSAATAVTASFAFGQAAASNPAAGSLPPAVSAAITRIASQEKQGDKQGDKHSDKHSLPELPTLNLNGLAIARLPVSVDKCSIPLLEHKVPAEPKFFMLQAPQPAASTEAMPVVRAQVCSAP